MTEIVSSNIGQIEYWNTKAGETWAKFQEALDRQIDPLGRATIDTLGPKKGEHVIDIGCGCGQTSLELGSRVGATGSVVGVDISNPMLKVARANPGSLRIRTSPSNVLTRSWTISDGEVSTQLSHASAYMFFSNPAAAFTNICKSLKPSDRLAFVCWRPLNQNAWIRAPLEVALPLLPPIAPFDPIAPGPFCIRRCGPC